MADGEVEIAVVVVVGAGGGPTEPFSAEVGAADVVGDIDKRAVGGLPEELRLHLVGLDAGPEDMPGGDEHLHPAVAVPIEPHGAEAEVVEARGGDPRLPADVGEEELAEVLVERVLRLIEVGEEDVGAAVTVEVLGDDSHRGLVLAVVADRTAGGGGELLIAGRGSLRRAPCVEVVGGHVVADIDLGVEIVVEVDNRYGEPLPAAVGLGEAEVGGAFHERPVSPAHPHLILLADIAPGAAVAAPLRIVAGFVVAEPIVEERAGVEVELAIVVEIGEGGAGAPLRELDPGGGGDVGERAVAVVVEENGGAEVGEVEIGKPVGVIVTDSDPLAVVVVADAGHGRDIAKARRAPAAVEPIAVFAIPHR